MYITYTSTSDIPHYLVGVFCRVLAFFGVGTVELTEDEEDTDA